MISSRTDRQGLRPVITARLGRLLGVVILLFSLLVLNSVYLAAVSLLEQLSGNVHQNYFYLLMFLLHQLQLHQDRLVLDTETYLDRHLIQHLQVQATPSTLAG